MKKSSFVEGTIIATIAIVLVKIIGVLYVIPFYATVGVEGSALYSYAYNIYAIFISISTAGIPVAMSKITNEYLTLGMNEAKVRAFKIGKKIVSFLSIFVFLFLMFFAEFVAKLIIGDLTGGNTVADVAFVIRAISFAILVIPYVAVSKGFLQGHKIIAPTSVSQIIDQVVRVTIIVLGSYIAINIFNASVTKAVGIAVFGAFVAGCVAYLYLKIKINGDKKQLGLNEKKLKKDKIKDSEILKKIGTYAIPFIIINVAVNVYNFINMILVLRTLDYLGYSAINVEFITSAISTWGSKLNMIVVSLATGMVISLIPFITSAFVKKDWQEVEKKINQAFKIIIIVSLPLTVGLSILATPVWTLFYGYNYYGPIIFRFTIFMALFANLYMISSSSLQATNKFKTVYKSSLLGFLLNAILDVPLMLAFYNLGLPPFHGATLATIIGYLLSIFIGVRALKKDNNISFVETRKMLFKALIPTTVMFITLMIIQLIIPINDVNRPQALLICIIYGAIGAIIYLVIAYKMKLLQSSFGEHTIKKIIKKLTFFKASD